jgi:hypothetical protein
MILIRGLAAGTGLTGTVFEPHETPPRYAGAPEETAPYVWVCDEFYEVLSGGTAAVIGGETIQIAFESPLPRGFDTETDAVDAAIEHLQLQFARVGVPSEDVEIEVERR